MKGRNCSQRKNSRDSSGQTTHPPGNDDLLILTRLLLSNDDSDDNFSKTPLKTRTVTVINQAILYPGLFSNYSYRSPPASNFEAHVCA
jgi:hypothetical protein